MTVVPMYIAAALAEIVGCFAYWRDSGWTSPLSGSCLGVASLALARYWVAGTCRAIGCYF